MTPRQLAWIFGLLALLLGGWLLLSRTGPGDEPGDDEPDGLDIGARIDADVEYVRIVRPEGETIELERRARGWTVDGFPARDSLVEATLAALDTLPPGRLIARSEGSHERLGLTERDAVRVQVGPAGRPNVEFLVGESGIDGRFVRLPGEARSYVVPSDVMDPLAGPEAGWRDYVIARVDTASLRRIRIRRGGGTAADLRRVPSAIPEWRVNGAAADTARVREYLETLARLRSTGFPADSFVYAADFENPAAVVELYLHAAADSQRPAPDLDGIVAPDLSLLFSTGLDHPDVLVRRADDPIVYALDRARANLLTTTAERLRGGD